MGSICARHAAWALMLAVMAVAAAAPAGSSFSELSPSRQLLQGSETEARIAGGKDAPCGRYPYMASLRDRSNAHKCGGVLVHKGWVLTAAHCVDPNKRSTVGLRPIVAIGACRLDDEENENGEVEMFLAKQTFIHQDWTGNVADGNDIAMLQLDEASEFTSVGLPTSSETLAQGDTLVAIGWGEQGNSSRPVNLQQADSIQFIDNEFCDSVDVWGDLIKDEMLCAFGFEQDVCQGDSGGPLLQVFAPNRNISAGDPAFDIVVGITSFGEKVDDCGTAKKPSVFTRLGAYAEWIDDRIQGKKLPPPTQPTALSDVAPVSENVDEPVEQPPAESVEKDATGPEAAPAPKQDEKSKANATEAPAEEDASSSLDIDLTPEEQMLADQKLWNASSDGDTIGVKDALTAGANVDVKLSKNGSTPLWRAVSKGHLPIVEVLLEEGADPDTTRNLDGVPALFKAAQDGKVDIVKALLEADADPDKSATDRNTPLYIAAQRGDVEIVEALLEAGAKPDKGVIDGSAPLFQASWFGHMGVVQILIEYGADVNRSRTSDGATPLIIASQYGQVEVVEILIDAEADVGKQADDGSTALLKAAENGCCTMFPSTRHLMVVQALLEEGADVNQGNDMGNRPLHFATVTLGRQSVRIAEELLDEEADIDVQAKDGRTPLIWAAYYGNIDMMEFLVENGADTSVADGSGANAMDSICECTASNEKDNANDEDGAAVLPPCPDGACTEEGVKETIKELLS